MTTGTRVFHPATPSITDWSGHVLDPAIARHLAVGHVVRIQVEEDADPGWIETPYVRITEVTDSALVAVVDDPYRGDDREIANGDVFTFAGSDVIEIPTDWDGNAALVPHVRLTGDNRMTGLIGHE